MSAKDEAARHAERERGEQALIAAGIGFVASWSDNDVLVFSVAQRDASRAKTLLRAARVFALVKED